MEASTRQWLVLGARVAAGCACLAFGVATLGDPLGHVADMRVAPVLSYAVAEQLAVALPALALVLGLAMVLGLMSRGAAVLSAVLALVLAVGGSSSPAEIARDVVVLAASVLVVIAGPGRLALDGASYRRRAQRTPAPTHLQKESVD